MTPSVLLTPTASAYVKQAITKNHGIGFRLSIKKTGCSGYSYLPEIIHDVNPLDLTLQLEDGVVIYLDSQWISLLNGVTVDYVEDEKSGLKQKRLVFTSPKESGRCGCGESFHVE